jgi:hypothetical protein
MNDGKYSASLAYKMQLRIESNVGDGKFVEIFPFATKSKNQALPCSMNPLLDPGMFMRNEMMMTLNAHIIAVPLQLVSDMVLPS